MSSLSLRPFETRDCSAIVNTHNAVYPDRPRSVQEVQTEDAKRNPAHLFKRLVAERDGCLCGMAWYGHNEWMYHPQKFYMGGCVHPEMRCRGVGSALYERVLEGVGAKALQLRVIGREDQPQGVRFLEKRGFKESMRLLESVLDVSTFNFAPYERLELSLHAQGIVIRTFAELARDPEHLRKLYDMEMVNVPDSPSPEPLTAPTFEHWVDTVQGNAGFLPDGYFIAVDEKTGTYAGSASLWRYQARDYLNTGFTGVRRTYRRRGIALALKARAIRYAQEQGAKSIHTDNESYNRAVLGINERLGFVRGTAEVHFVKAL
jgi:GNAT superfamily N-acetyltransferase